MEHGRRTATLVARTDCTAAAATRDQIDWDSLASLARQHDREDRHAQA
jgi:CRP-like cAMP-binding protein